MKDITGAINAGYTNQELNTALGIEGVDFEGASAAGYSNEDILGGLNLEEKQMSKIWFDDKTTTKPSRITSLLDAAGGSPQTGKDVGITQEQIDSAISPQAAIESVDNALNFVSPAATAATGIRGLFGLGKSAIAKNATKGATDYIDKRLATIGADGAKYMKGATSATEQASVKQATMDRMSKLNTPTGQATVAGAMLSKLPKSPFTDWLSKNLDAITSPVSAQAAFRNRNRFLEKAKDGGLSGKSAMKLYNELMRNT